MRAVIGLVMFVAVSIVPRIGSAQVSVTSPAAGAASSYRTTTISWNPIPGATSYHLEIDDDPNFGSPEVDVTVAGTSYALSGQRLKLNGQQSWAAYVRINGTRWNANTFTPSYFGVGGNAALAVTSQNLVFLAFHDDRTRIHLTASSDWSMRRPLTLSDTFNADAVNLAVDEFDVAHAFWVEQRPTENRVPYYTSSATGWDLVRIPGTVEGCLKGSSFAARGQFEIFLSCNNPDEITRWTITNGTQFARAGLPNSANTDSASTARDGVGNVYVASTRDGFLGNQPLSVLQGSGDGFIPHTAASGRNPAIAVTREGELHALLSEWDDATGTAPVFYSNSLRGFQTWTALPIRTPNYMFGEVPPLVVDATRGRLYTAIRIAGGVHVCSAAHTGLASNTGTSWTCAPVTNEIGPSHATGVLAPDGTVHFAWSDHKGVGYANSLGSFLAKNFSPQITFGTPSSTASAAIVPAAISDIDGDDIAGQIHVGRIQDVVSLVEPDTIEPILHDQYTIRNAGGWLHDAASGIFTWLEFRVSAVSNSFSRTIDRDQISTFPATVEVSSYGRYVPRTTIGTFQILAWDSTGATISQTDFVASVMLDYSSGLPGEIDISSVPAGNAAVGISASDGSTSEFGSKRFTKTTGQTRLLLTTP